LLGLLTDLVSFHETIGYKGSSSPVLIISYIYLGAIHQLTLMFEILWTPSKLALNSTGSSRLFFKEFVNHLYLPAPIPDLHG
jgi:hypothetical protein